MSIALPNPTMAAMTTRLTGGTGKPLYIWMCAGVMATLAVVCFLTTEVHAKTIAAGNGFTCAIRNNAVYCWGNNGNGQSGADPAKVKKVSVPTPIDLGTTKIPEKIAAGSFHACVLFTDKTGKCWGYNSAGQLGNGTYQTSYKAVDISGGSAMEDIVVGDDSTCVRVTNGNVYCWGLLVQADGSNKTFTTPVLYSSAPMGAIAANLHGYCANISNTIGCFGLPQFSIGLKYPNNTSTPVAKYMVIDKSFGVGNPGLNLSMSGSAQIKDLGVGKNFVCAATTAGQVQCAGEYLLSLITEGFPAVNNKLLGLAASQGPGLTTVYSLDDAQSLSAGLHHVCAVRQGGLVACWGADWMGELGQGTINPSSVAVTVPGLGDVIEVSAGHYHTCALLQSGGVTCWGSTALDAIGPEASVPNKGYVSIKDFCATGLQSCGYAKSPVAIAGLPAPSSPVAPPVSTNATPCAAEWYYAKDRKHIYGPYKGCQDIPDDIDGDPKMWCATQAGYFENKGYNTDWIPCSAFGASSQCVKSPWLFVNSKGFPPGPYTGCANPDKDTGGDWCPTKIAYVAGSKAGTKWEYCSPVGASVPPTTGTIPPPGGIEVVQPADTKFKEPSTQKNTLAVGDEFTCMIKEGAIQCTGKNSFGQLGNGQTSSKPVTKPVKVALPAGAKPISISAGISNACAILSDQSLMCWGANTYGQLGDGTTAGSATPVAVMGLGPAVRVALGGSSACAVTPAGMVYCWGGGAMGQLGNGANLVVNAYPTKVSGVSGVLDVGMGIEFACALVDNGQVYCWGNNTYGQLGKGDKLPSNVPVAVKDGSWCKYITGATSLTVGAQHACALFADKTGKCWGSNSRGQLGANKDTSEVMTAATPIFGGSAMEEIVAHGNTTCTRVTNGKVYCWGENANGQFGNGAKGYTTTPVLAFNGQTVSALGVGAQHVCVISDKGQLACQGSDNSGQLEMDPTKTSGPSSSLTATDALTKMIDLHHQLVASLPAANKYSVDLSNEVSKVLEPAVKALVDGKTPADIKPDAAAVQLQKDAAAAVAKPLELYQQMTELFVGIFPPSGVNQAYGTNINEVYAQAVGIYMSALISQAYDWPEQKPNCTTSIIEKENLLNYLTSFGKDMPKASGVALGIVKDMQCLTPSSAAHLGNSIYTAYTLITKIVGQWRPAYAQPVKDALMARFAVLLFPLEDITRSQFPEDPSLLMLSQYVERLNKVPWNKKINEYGLQMEVPFLYMRNPAKALYEDTYGIPGMGIPFCSGGSEGGLYYKLGYTQYNNQQIDIAALLPKAQDVDGEKNIFGALVTDVAAQTCGNPTKVWPVWNAYSGNVDNVYQGCMIFKNYANVAVNPVLLSNGTCKDWNTSRIGKPCCVPPKTSLLEKGAHLEKQGGFAAVWDFLSNLWVSTAYAQTRASSSNAQSAPATNAASAPLLPASVRNPIVEMPGDPYAAAIAGIVCPPDRCYVENTELVFKSVFGAEHRYPNMTREKFVEQQLQTIAASKAAKNARESGVEPLRNHLLQTAPLIVRGTPTAQTVESPKDNIRRTLYAVTVNEVLRGKYEQPTLTLVVPGGCITKDDCETVLGLRSPQINQEAVFLLNPLTVDHCGLADLSESVYRVENGRLPDWNLDLSVVRERAKAAVPAVAPAATSTAPVTPPARTTVPAAAAPPSPRGGR